MNDVLIQLLPPNLSESYRQGYGQLEGYVVLADDVAFARGPLELVDAFGYGRVAGTYAPDNEYVDLLRFAVAPTHRIEIASGGNDPMHTGEQVPIVDKPPFTGNGFTASERAVVPQWRVARDRLAPGTELVRVHQDGTWQPLARYLDVATSWRGPAMDPSASNALPAHLVGMRAHWNGVPYLADLLEDGTVALANLGETAPPDFERTTRLLSRRQLPREDIELLDEVITACHWRGEPFEVIGVFGNWCRLAYTGRNSYTAEALGLDWMQPGVYEASVPRSELTDVSGVARELAPTDVVDGGAGATAASPVGAGDAGDARGTRELPETGDPAWDDFAQQLHGVLRDLEERTYLIIRWRRGNAFVQYHQSDDELNAEAVADEFTSEQLKLGVAAVGHMHEAGWTPPTVDPAGRLNWHLDLPWAATSADYRHLARASVAALRIRSVPSPDELVYRAWQDPEPPPRDVTFDPAALDPGNPRLELPNLGLAYR